MARRSPRSARRRWQRLRIWRRVLHRTPPAYLSHERHCCSSPSRTEFRTSARNEIRDTLLRHHRAVAFFPRKRRWPADPTWRLSELSMLTRYRFGRDRKDGASRGNGRRAGGVHFIAPAGPLDRACPAAPAANRALEFAARSGAFLETSSSERRSIITGVEAGGSAVLIAAGLGLSTGPCSNHCASPPPIESARNGLHPPGDGTRRDLRASKPNRSRGPDRRVALAAPLAMFVGVPIGGVRSLVRFRLVSRAMAERPSPSLLSLQDDEFAGWMSVRCGPRPALMRTIRRRRQLLHDLARASGHSKATSPIVMTS